MVSRFLSSFHAHLNTWGVLFWDDRGKNTQALLDLEIVPIERENILKEIEVHDYSEGPIKDQFLRNAELWIFGKTVKEQEVYIKISLGVSGSKKVVCVSFHVADHTMNYPLK